MDPVHPKLLARYAGVAAFILFGGWLVMRVGLHLGPMTSGRFATEAMLVAVAGVSILAFRKARPSQGVMAWSVGVLALIAVTALLLQANGRVQRFGQDRQVAEWGTFHYYLGGKYFDELHYTDLYKQAVIADWDGGDGPNRYREVLRVRDLHTYDFVKTEDVRQMERLDSFSDARWESFKRDIRWFGRQAGLKRWRKILADRGYNPPPSYVLVSGFLCGVLPIDRPVTQTLLVSLDMLWLLAALFLSIRAYGTLRSLLVLCTFLLWYGNVNRVFGQIWILDWFAASWMALSAWKLRRPGLSGGLIAYAACMRVFPGVLLAGPIVANLPRIIRERRVPAHVLRFSAVAAIVGLLLVSLSWMRYGTEAWVDWATNISEHNEEHESGARRFGLKQVFVLDWDSGLKGAPKLRTRHIKENHTAYGAMRLLFVLLALGCMLKSDEHDAMLFGCAIFFAGIVASRYYGALLVLLMLLGLGNRAPPDRARPPVRLAFDFLMLMLIWAVYASPFGGEPRQQYVFSNTLWVAWWMGLFGVTLLLPRSDRSSEEPLYP